MVAAGTLATLAACGSPDVTAAKVEASLAPTFDNVYTQRAQLLGLPGVTPSSTGAHGKCYRTSTKKLSGPGADWICKLTYTGADHKKLTGKFELQVKSNSCYVAGAPTSQVGPVTITAKNGQVVTNPAFEFDGCFDPD
jgi:hypothetical protein